MGRPIEATGPLDLDTIKLLLWVSEYGTGQPNISRLYDRESADGLAIGRGTFFSAIKGKSVTQETVAKIDEMIALRGWKEPWLEHLREEHKRRVVQAFKHLSTHCPACGHECSHCGKPQTEKRRQAVKAFLKTDPVDLGCRVHDQS